MACDECDALRELIRKGRCASCGKDGRALCRRCAGVEDLVEMNKALLHFMAELKSAIQANANDTVWMLYGPETACDAIDRMLAENGA